MGVTQQQLDQAFVDYRKVFGGLKEDYFALLYLAREFDKPVEDLTQQVAFGGNDYGLDAFHIDPARKILYLYQFKWSNSHQLFKSSIERLISAGIDRVFGNPYQDQAQNPFLAQLKAELFENQALIEKVFFNFVFNGDPAEAENSAVLDQRREDLEAKKHLIDSYFERDSVAVVVQFLSNETRRAGAISRTRKTFKFAVPVDDHVVKQLGSGETMHVGFVPLFALHRMFKEMGQRLFDRNIRAGLSEDRSPNRAIRGALLDIAKGADPAAFAFNHNGVTLTADEVTFEDGVAHLTEPRVLNGAQTITSVDTFLEKQRDHPAIVTNRSALEEIHILAKIITKATPEFITSVTIANNKQNPVSPWNLRASDDIQLELQDKFRLDLQIYYARQEKSFEALTDEDLEQLGINDAKAIEMRRLALTFLAAQGELDKMNRLPEVFENEKSYRSTFKPGYLQADSRKILLGYKIQFRLRRIMDEIVADRQKYEFLRRAAQVTWALLIQALLNHPKALDLAEQYGQTLSIETGFSEELKKLARSRVKPIIDIAVRHDERNQKLMSEERYSFLKTNKFFADAMEIAYKQYRWNKLSF